jgi:hypothetical protein
MAVAGLFGELRNTEQVNCVVSSMLQAYRRFGPGTDLGGTHTFDRAFAAPQVTNVAFPKSRVTALALQSMGPRFAKAIGLLIPRQEPEFGDARSRLILRSDHRRVFDDPHGISHEESFQ